MEFIKENCSYAPFNKPNRTDSRYKLFIMKVPDDQRQQYRNMAVVTAFLRPRPSEDFALISKLPSSSSTSPSMKLKTLLQTLIISHVCRLFRALSKAKAFLLQMFNKKGQKGVGYPKKATKKQKKIFFGSFRLHYNWCSSHIVPIPAPATAGEGQCHESIWNSVFSVEPETGDGIDEPVNSERDQSKLSGYLQWLEEKDSEEFHSCIDEQEMNEIDRLADIFIANLHEKFRLEKVESYRRFQEMLARSL